MSMDIADFRPYVQGDDPRHLDWGALAKFDQLVVRLFYAERAMRVAIFLDCSRSMDFGTPRKFNFARSLAACLGLIALNGRNELSLFPLRDGDSARSRLRASTSLDAGMADVLRELESLRADGIMDWAELLGRAGQPQCDVRILISDCLPPRDLSSAFRAATSGGAQLVVLHVLCPEELTPKFAGAMTLRDRESNRVMRIGDSTGAMRGYTENMHRWKNALAHSVRSCGGTYIDISTSDDIIALLNDRMRTIFDHK